MERNTYRTSQLLKILGVSRDALRYYEEKGIVKPDHDETNHYRQYDDYDIYTLLVTDFYKKRNLSMKEIRELQEGTTIEELDTLLEKKIEHLEEAIRYQQYMLQKLKETKAFTEEVEGHLNQYSIMEFPTYEVLGEFSDFYSFLEYPMILEKMDMAKDDIFSKIMREFTFDETGLLDSKMYIVDKPRTIQKEKGRHYLQYAKCIYTIVEDSRYQNEKEDIKYKVFESTLKWGKERGLNPIGTAFVTTRLITYLDKKERAFLEVFIPIKDIDLGVTP